MFTCSLLVTQLTLTSCQCLLFHLLNTFFPRKYFHNDNFSSLTFSMHNLIALEAEHRGRELFKMADLETV